MTSLRQIKANRCNATKSTGPKTEIGKMRSRRNAVQHGLSAETVIEIVEDVDDYKGFEAAIIADYDARTAVERELVLRLASLLWRLRRATAIETDLLTIQAEILIDRRYARLEDQHARSLHGHRQRDENDWPAQGEAKYSAESSFSCYARESPVPSHRDVALSFQRLSNLDSAVFERLGRYEAALGPVDTYRIHRMTAARVTTA